MTESDISVTEPSSPEPGWWQASDGKWYPPEAAAVPPPTVQPPPPAPPLGSPVRSASELRSSASKGQGPFIAQIMFGLVGAVFMWAGIQLSFDLASEYGDVTFGSLLLTAPLFSVGILGFGVVWYIRQANETNELLVELVDEMRKANAARGDVR